MAIEAAKLMVRVGSDTTEAERGLKSMGATVQNAGRAMTQTGLAMTAGITAPLLGIAAAALNSAADFEQSMNVLQQVTGATTGTMDEMTAAALKLGAETSFSAGEAAGAMLELAKAGMETDEVLASIGGVMDLAAAGGIALADAANITANALNAFGLEATEADRVANLLAGGANNSSANISDLSQGLAAAGFAFANANQPIENLVASLAILTDVGLTGSDAGTALKNAFMRLMAPTKEAQAVMSELNLEFYDASGQMKALPDMIDMMNKAFADMTPQQRDAALSTLFLSDGMKAMIPLLDAGVEGFNDMVTAVSAEGQASAVAGARMKGLRGAIEYLKGSVDSFLIGAARPFLDMIGEWIRMGADWLTNLGKLPPAVTNAALAFAAVLAVAGPLALAIGGLISVFSTLNPIILAITVAVAALAAAWSADFMGIQGAAQSAWDTISGFFAEVATQATTVADAIGRAFSNTTFPTLAELWADFSAGDFAALATKITSTAYELMVNLDAELNISATAIKLRDQLVAAVTGLGTAISGVDFAAKIEAIGTQMTLVRDSIYSSLTTAITAVPWTTVGTTIQTKIDELTTFINGLTLEGIDWKATFETILVAPVKLAIGAIQWLFSGTDFTNLSNAVNTAIQDIGWTGIAEALEGLGTAIGSELTQLVIDIANDFGVELSDLSAEGFSAAAQAWKTRMQADLLIYAPDMSLAATIWAKLFANKLETTEPDFTPAAGKIGADLVAAIVAGKTDFSPAAVVMEESLRTSLTKTDYTLAGEAAGNSLANAAKVAFGAAVFINSIGTTIDTWTNNLSQTFREKLLSGDISTSIGEFFTRIGTDIGQFMTDVDTKIREFVTGFSTSLGEALGIPTPAWMTDFLAWADKTDATVNGWIEGFGAWADNTKKSFDVWLSAAEKWAASVQTTFNTWMGAAETWIAGVGTTLSTWLAGAESWIATVTQSLSTWLSGVQSWIATVTQALSAWLAGASSWIGTVGTTLTGWISSAQGWILNVGATLTSWLNRAIGWVSSLLTAPPWVSDLIAFAANIPVWVSNLMDWTPSWLDDLFGFTIDIPDPVVPETPEAESSSVLPPATIGMAQAKAQTYYAAAGASVHIGSVHIHNDMEVEVLAATIARRISQGGRR